MEVYLEDVQTCPQGVTRFLKRCVSDVQLQIGSERITNGPEGTVANKTMQSSKLMLKSITCLLKASEFMSPDATNSIKLQSLLTLVVENLHVTMKMKHPAPSLLDYCRDFGKAMRESIKQITNWSTKCFNHRKSYYPIPELTNYGSFRYCKIKSNSSSPQGQDEHCKDEGMGE